MGEGEEGWKRIVKQDITLNRDGNKGVSSGEAILCHPLTLSHLSLNPLSRFLGGGSGFCVTLDK